MSTHRLIRTVLATSVVTTGLILGGGAAAQAAPLVFCATATAGSAGVVSCAANGVAYTFQAKVTCQNSADAAVQRDIYGPVANPGGSSAATCAVGERVATVGYVVN